MENKIFRFNIGQFNCTAIRDDDDGNINSLLIDTGKQQVLIDPGIGYDFFPLNQHPGLLRDSLLGMGISPSEIDLVILSHADADHIGGGVDESGNAAFPRARYVLSREEQAYWSSKPERMQPSKVFADFITDELCQVNRSVPPTRLAQLHDKLELIDPETEIVPGIRGIAAPGHTPGQMIISISSDDEELRFMGDVFYSPDDIGNLEWHSALDVDPAQSAATRNLLLEQAAKDHTLLMAYHAPFPGLGYIMKQETGWGWKVFES